MSVNFGPSFAEVGRLFPTLGRRAAAGVGQATARDFWGGRSMSFGFRPKSIGSAQFGPKWGLKAASCRHRDSFVRIGPNLARARQIRAEFYPDRPNLAEVHQLWADVGQLKANVGRNRSKRAGVDQLLAEVGQNWTKSAEFGRIWVEVGQVWVGPSGPCRTEEAILGTEVDENRCSLHRSTRFWGS